jgi:hypothetical protein
MLILVWLDPQQPDQIQMSLHLIEEGSWTIEIQPTIIETTVNDLRAIWTVGCIWLWNADIQFTRISMVMYCLGGKQVTYRLETDLELMKQFVPPNLLSII